MIVPAHPLVAVYIIPATEKIKQYESKLKVLYIDDEHDAWVLGNDGAIFPAERTKHFDRIELDDEHITSVIPALPGWRILVWYDDADGVVVTEELEIVAWENRNGELRPMVFDGRSATVYLDLDSSMFLAVLGPASTLTADDKRKMAAHAHAAEKSKRG